MTLARTSTCAGARRAVIALTLPLLAIGRPASPPALHAQQAATAAARGAALRQRLQAKLDSVHAAGTFPGATVGVTLPTGESFGLAVGMSDTALKRPMTPADRMLQGSVGKTYVAAVALQLVGEGKLALDDKVSTYLGREAWYARVPNAPNITVRMLMTHTSGVMRYEFKEEFTRDLTRQPDKVWRPDELIAYVLDVAPPFAAGQGWDYSDTNYILLGMIIERLTGSTLYREIDRRLLRPLGLRNTIPSNSRTIPGLAQGYAGANNPFGGTDAMIVDGKFAINPQFEWAGGGFASTAEDLARWAKALYEGKAYPPALAGQALAGVSAPALGGSAKYGLGVIIRPTPLGVTYGHSGFFPGYITEVRYWPTSKLALALQVNSSVGRALGQSPGTVLLDLARIITGEGAKQ
ncbi:MAG: serine hydrolase domain-containing protein [Gemmatimonadaceae bacterium]